MYRQSLTAVAMSLWLILPQPVMAASAAQGTNQPPAGTDKGKEPAKRLPEDLVFSPSTFFDNFNDTTKFGSDIFFPGTKRFVRKVETPTPGVPVKNESPVFAQLVLKGISGTGARRLAVVNTRTLAQGEVWEMKLNGQVHRVKCEQIKPRSVILSVEGFPEKKELQLRDGL